MSCNLHPFLGAKAPCRSRCFYRRFGSPLYPQTHHTITEEELVKLKISVSFHLDKNSITMH